jgi:hypothetical protein
MNNNEYVKEKLKAIAELLKKLNDEIHKLSKLLK